MNRASAGARTTGPGAELRVNLPNRVGLAIRGLTAGCAGAPAGADRGFGTGPARRPDNDPAGASGTPPPVGRAKDAEAGGRAGPINPDLASRCCLNSGVMIRPADSTAACP